MFMPLKFSQTRQYASFLNPFNDFRPSRVEVDIRRDPLTGDCSRILAFRFKSLGKLDHSLFLERDQKRPCPFCPGNLEKMAGRFLPEAVPEGFLTRGEAVCFPNVFPYGSHTFVIRLTKAHYLRPSQFTPAQVSDGLLLAAQAFRRLAPGDAYGSVNWNYMMPAGGGQTHPHFQIVSAKRPTRYQAVLLRRARAFARRHGRDMIEAYLEHEKADRSRWVGRLGAMAWTTPFAPRAIYDLMALSPGGKGLLELGPKQVEALARGVCRVLSYFESKGVGSHNMTLHTSLKPGAGLPMMLRLVSRIQIPPMGIDEINYFEKLHDETVCFLSPEEMAQEIREVWRD
jgi:galactose-1-phosphate uridylyltransferase